MPMSYKERGSIALADEVDRQCGILYTLQPFTACRKFVFAHYDVS